MILIKDKPMHKMDWMHKMDKYKLPLEWIDRIFQRLTDIYGSRFTTRFAKSFYVDIEKTRWQSGLYGVSAEEIKHVLNLCQTSMIKDAPNLIEFYHYCKGIKKPPEKKASQFVRTAASKKVSEKYLKLILDKLHGRLDSEGQATLSALDKQILSKQDDKNAHWQDD